MKKGVVILGLIAALGLSGCGSIPVSSSSSDDGDVIAQSKAVVEQSKAVVEESKAVVDESKAVEKVKGNSDTVEETGPEKTVSSSEEISHPFLILEYEDEKFDIANDTVKDLIYFVQKMGIHSDIDLSKTIEPYGFYDYELETSSGHEYMIFTAYNPYDKEIAIKDAKLCDGDHHTALFIQGDVFDDIKFLNGKADLNSSFDEWMEVFKEEAEIIWDSGAYHEAYDNARKNGEKYTGPEPPEDDYANVLNYRFGDNGNTIVYGFRLDDGREVDIDQTFWNDGDTYIDFSFQQQYE